MNVDKRIVAPFNEWWRAKNHCEPDLKAIEAFAAGFKAGMDYTLAETRKALETKP